jgi:hypothetical protein
MNLNRRELRLVELYNKYNEKNLEEVLKEYHFLIDTLHYVTEAISETKESVKYWQKSSETLLYKFTFHGLTMHQILSGLPIHSDYFKEELEGRKIIDIASAKTVFRAQLEAFLMYHYIYVNPGNDDLKELRYNAWIYSGLLQRQEFPSETAFGKAQKERDKTELEKMRKKISELPAYSNLSSKQQKSLLESGSGKLFSHWATILKETGFSEKNPFYSIYVLLSMYAHSEGLSAIQMDQKQGQEENNQSQAFLDLYHSKLLICLMAKAVVQLFSSAADRFATLPELTRYDLELYAMMAGVNKES